MPVQDFAAASSLPFFILAHIPLDGRHGERLTGSVHIAELADHAAGRAFAYDEPFAKAGLFERIVVKRFESALDHRQRDFTADPDSMHFLVHAVGRPGATAERDALNAAHRQYFNDHYKDIFIARGPLRSDDGREWIGSAMLIELPDRPAVDEFFAREPYTQGGLYEHIEVRRWRFGGRANLADVT